ncbi:hypothetical protein C1H46_044175 [Malus baccata]|uniref:Uncharacterized protein n=1 Tax=Malus baccata TaxID=106549 RepID=A0A540K7T6_MALBA|nr:hypothetical protein C1H46_044175 [Malus baccata]
MGTIFLVHDPSSNPSAHSHRMSPLSASLHHFIQLWFKVLGKAASTNIYSRSEKKQSNLINYL